MANQSDTDKNLTVISAPNIDKKKASKTWAALIKKVFEVDPLICKKCGGTLKVILLRPCCAGCYGGQEAFITDHHEVKRLLDNLGIPTYIQPQPILTNAPPETFTPDPELFAAEAAGLELE